MEWPKSPPSLQTPPAITIVVFQREEQEEPTGVSLSFLLLQIIN